MQALLTPSQKHCTRCYLVGEGLWHGIEFVERETLFVNLTVAETLRRIRVFAAQGILTKVISECTLVEAQTQAFRPKAALAYGICASDRLSTCSNTRLGTEVPLQPP